MATMLDQIRATLENGLDRARTEDDMIPVVFNRKQMQALAMGLSFLDGICGTMALFVSEVMETDEEGQDGQLQS